MEESKKEIIEATNSALQNHSYSDLSIQNIADEFDKSKSLLYHHYSGKDEILLDFLDYMLERFKEEVLDSEEYGLEKKFAKKAFLVFNLDEDYDFMKTLEELRAQGLRDERYREKFHILEKIYKEKLKELIKEGMAQGSFKTDIDLEKVSEFIIAVNNETLHRKAADKDVQNLEDELESYLSSRVYRHN